MTAPDVGANHGTRQATEAMERAMEDLTTDVMSCLIAGGLTADTAEVTSTGIRHVITALHTMGVEFAKPSEDGEECEACWEIEGICRFHEGAGFGFGAASRMVRAVMYEPEILPWKGVRYAEHDEGVGHLAEAICRLSIDHEHTEGTCWDARKVAREMLADTDPRAMDKAVGRG